MIKKPLRYKILAFSPNVYIFLIEIKALIIAFSSDFLDKIAYYFEKNTIDGFTEKNLLFSNITSSSPTSNITCRYFETKYHGDINTNTYRYYQIVVLKLIFVIAYQVRLFD